VHNNILLGRVVPSRNIRLYLGLTLESTKNLIRIALETKKGSVKLGEGSINLNKGRDNIYFANNKYKYNLSISNLH